MDAVRLVSVLAVAVFGLFLAGLGLMSWLSPAQVRRLLSGFAATAGRHWLELAVRAAVGMALVIAAPGLPASGLLRLFGGVLLATTLVMAMLPWRWHQRFSAQRVPRALSFLGLIGGVSLAAGLGLLAAAWQGLAR
jgi:hypothetical protein